MTVLNTFCAFNYGHTITIENNIIPLDDGPGEIAVEIDVGSYSLGEFAVKVNEALNNDGTQEYTVSLDRDTRVLTISAPGNFYLLFNSSSNSGISARELLGFDDQDYSGTNTFTAPNPSGSQYIPQFKLQNFVDFPLNKKVSSATINETGSGRVEVVKYADQFFMKCDITLITDIEGQGVIRNNAQGVQDAIDFIDYATRKTNIEFVYDIENQGAAFERCLLESTAQSRDGTNYELKPLYSRGLTGYYELSKLVFRRL